ncbi:hypothetical protein BGX38DRAFT_1215933, partial [Terfezia claveryi]
MRKQQAKTSSNLCLVTAEFWQADTEDKGSDLVILDDEQEADGSDDEQEDYITEEETVRYAKIMLGEDRVI